MKKLILFIPALILAGMFFYACQEETVVQPNTVLNRIIGDTDYDIVLVSKTQLGDGNWEWIWSIQNTQPYQGGSNSSGTQDLSHWSFVPGSCLVLEDIVSAAYSFDGSSYTEIQGPFAFNQDPSILNTCNLETGDVFKFDIGTDGTNKTYYKLVINKNYAINNEAVLWYKTGGQNSKCGTDIFDGIGCPPIIEYCYQQETAWAAGTRYVKKGNWATYTPYQYPTTTAIKLYAGQTYEAGSVTFSDVVNGNITITITLGSDWSLQVDEYGNILPEAVKIQGYETTPPASNPSPGQFAYKGNSLTVTVPAFNFYGIHLDVRKQVVCP